MRTLPILTAITVILMAACSSNPEYSLIGEWQGEGDQGISFSYEFLEDGNLTIVDGTTVMNGETVEGSLTWSLDGTKKDPLGEYVTLVVNVDGELMTKQKLRWVRFISATELEMALGDHGTPDENNFTILTKQ